MTLLLPQAHHSHRINHTVLSTSGHHHLLATLSLIYTDAYYLEVDVWLMLQGVHRISHVVVASLHAQCKQITANIQWSSDGSHIYVYFNTALFTVAVSYPTGASSYPSAAFFHHYLHDDNTALEHISLSLQNEATIAHSTSMDLHQKLLFGTNHGAIYVLNAADATVTSIRLMNENYMSHIKELHVPLFGATTTQHSTSALHDLHLPSSISITQCCSCSELRLVSCLSTSGGISFLRQLSNNSYQSTPHVFIMSQRKNYLFDHVLLNCHSYAHLICLSSSTHTDNDITMHSVDVLHYKCQYSDIALSLQLMWSTQVAMVASETIAARSQFIVSDDNVIVLVDTAVYCLNASGTVYAHHTFSSATLADNHILTLAVVLNQVIVTASSVSSVNMDESPLLLPNSQSIDSTTHSEAPQRSHNGAILQRRKSYPPSKRATAKNAVMDLDLSVANISLKTCTVQPSNTSVVTDANASIYIIPLITSSVSDDCLLLHGSYLKIHSLHLHELHSQYVSNMYDIGPRLFSPPVEHTSLPSLCFADTIHNSTAALLQWMAVSSSDHIAVLCGHRVKPLLVWFYSIHTKMWKRVHGSADPISMNIVNSDEYDIPLEPAVSRNKVVAVQWISNDFLIIISNDAASGYLQIISRLTDKKQNVHTTKSHHYCKLPISPNYADVLPCHDEVIIAVGNDHYALILKLAENEVKIVRRYDVRVSIRAVSQASHSVRQVMLHDDWNMALVLQSGLLVHMMRGSGAKIVNDYATPVQRIMRVVLQLETRLHIIVIQCDSRYFIWLPSYDGQQTAFGTIVPLIQHQNAVMLNAFDINNALKLSCDYDQQHLAVDNSIAVSLLLGLLNVMVERPSSLTLQHSLLKHQLHTRLAHNGISIIKALLKSLSPAAVTDVEYILYTIIAHQRQQELALFISVVFAAHEELFLNIMSRLSRRLESSVNASLYPLPNFSYGLSSPAKSPWTQLLLYELCLTHNYVTFASRFLTATCESYGGSDTPLSTVVSLLLTTELAYKCLSHGNIVLALESLSFCARLDLIALEHIASPIRLAVPSHPNSDIYSRALENVYSTFTLSGAQTLLSYMFGDDVNTLVANEIVVPMVHLYNCSIANPDRLLQAADEGVCMSQGSYTYAVMPHLQQRIFDSCVDTSEDAKMDTKRQEETSNPKQLLSYTEALLLHYFDTSIKKQQLCTATVAMFYMMQSSIYAPNGIHIVHHRMVNPLPVASPWNYAATTHAMLQYVCKIFGFAMLKPVSVALNTDGKIKKYSHLMLRRLCAHELGSADTLTVDVDEDVSLVALLRSLLAVSVVTQRMDIMLFVTLIFDRLDLALECWFRAANMQKLVDFCFGKQVSPVGIDYSNFSSSRTDVSQMKKIFHERTSMGLVDILHSIETLFQRDVPS